MPVPDPQQVGDDTVAGTALHVRVHALRRHAIRTRLLQYGQNLHKKQCKIYQFIRTADKKQTNSTSIFLGVVSEY
jgi:hypothetical protein